MRIAFFGTPAPAVPSLRAFLGADNGSISHLVENFPDLHIERVDGCDLRGADFREARFVQCRMTDCRLDGARLDRDRWLSSIAWALTREIRLSAVSGDT